MSGQPISRYLRRKPEQPRLAGLTWHRLLRLIRLRRQVVSVLSCFVTEAKQRFMRLGQTMLVSFKLLKNVDIGVGIVEAMSRATEARADRTMSLIDGLLSLDQANRKDEKLQQFAEAVGEHLLADKDDDQHGDDDMY